MAAFGNTTLFGGQKNASFGDTLFGAQTEKRQRAGSASEAPASLSGGSLFGQTSTAGSGAAGGAFGSTTGGFGSTTGGFGSTTGGFGSTTGGFGSTAGGFGSTTGGFGSTTGAFGNPSGGFGSTTGAFGSQQASQPAQTSTLFGTGSTGVATTGAFGGQQQQQQSVQASQPAGQPTSEAEELSRQLLAIKECWDPASASYQFRHYFYNVAEPGQAHLYQCPAGQDPVLWQQALSDNPDPTTLVPVLANGFEDLRKRVDSQSLQMQSYQERTSEVSGKLGKILQKHHSHTTVRLAECRRRQAELSQRLLEFMKLLQLVRLRGQLLNSEEETFRLRVEHLEKEMARSGSLKQRLAELQDHTYRLQAGARRRRALLGRAGGGGSGDGYEVADEAQLESVMRMLSDKQKGLARMTQIVAQDAEAIGSIEAAIGDRFDEVQKQKEARERVQVARSLAQPW